MKKRALKKRTRRTGSLVGKWFHSFKEGAVEWQGQVLSEPRPGYYLVRTYDWALGQPYDQRLVDIAGMVGWAFYDTHEEMKTQYQLRYSKREASS